MRRAGEAARVSGFFDVVIHVNNNPDGDPNRTAGHVAGGEGEADVLRLVHGAEKVVDIEKFILGPLAFHVGSPLLGELRIGDFRGVFEGHRMPDPAGGRRGLEGIAAENLLSGDGAEKGVVVELKGYDLHGRFGLWVGLRGCRSRIGPYW